MKTEKVYNMPDSGGTTVKITVFAAGFIFFEFVGLPCQLRAYADELACRELPKTEGEALVEIKCCAKKSSVPLWKLRMFQRDATELMSLIQWQEDALKDVIRTD
ncbi:hypothetical protein [Martelella alba]|uniref:Pyocin activator protein PrtN n=1 Tax=Martelella alba TaxID=2590451 RepID=A0ABY2SNS5_9HYPH|nr:hypothetical protein [Martelella alba]TKI07671.1 hypothetical protein FCN80_04285 [Martelella alba]